MNKNNWKINYRSIIIFKWIIELKKLFDSNWYILITITKKDNKRWRYRFTNEENKYMSNES